MIGISQRIPREKSIIRNAPVVSPCESIVKSSTEKNRRDSYTDSHHRELLSDGQTERPESGTYVSEKGAAFWTGEGREEQANAIWESHISWQRESFAKKEASCNKNPYKLKVNSSAYSVTGAYARLAGAGTKVRVRAAMGEARRSIGSLRLASSFGENKERDRARSAIASLQKLLLRGGQKLRRLNTEEILQLREKRVRQREEDRKAMRMRIELEKKRNTRKALDSALAMEGHLADVNHAYRYHNYEHDRDGAMPLPSQLAIPVVPSASSVLTEGMASDSGSV